MKPVVILVCPQMCENVGMAARAMMNCGLDEMRLVNPRENHLDDKAIAASSGAERILQQAKVFASTAEAVADLNLLYASTARRRNMVKTESREKEIYKVTIIGSIVNFIMVLLKFIAAVVGKSSAMLADAVHSLSDFITDIIVIVFVRLSSKPADSSHDYGHGKYETLATVIIGIALIAPCVPCQKIHSAGLQFIRKFFHIEIFPDIRNHCAGVKIGKEGISAFHIIISLFI